MSKETKATLENGILTAETIWQFAGEEPSTRKITLTKTDPLNPTTSYWAAINGECFGLHDSVGNTCIASVEDALHALAGRGCVYVVWPLHNPKPNTWQRWSKKWGARTKTATAY